MKKPNTKSLALPTNLSLAAKAIARMEGDASIAFAARNGEAPALQLIQSKEVGFQALIKNGGVTIQISDSDFSILIDKPELAE